MNQQQPDYMQGIQQAWETPAGQQPALNGHPQGQPSPPPNQPPAGYPTTPPPSAPPSAPPPQVAPQEPQYVPQQQVQQSGEEPRLPWHGTPGQRRATPVPLSGWRRAAFKATGGSWNPGLSRADQQWHDWMSIIDVPVRTHRIAVSCLKGGIGKTTTTVGVGTVYALNRRDMTTAIDANPDRGTLAQRLGPEHTFTVRDLIEHAGEITGADVLRQFTHQARSRLEVLASDRDPTKARAFSPDDYMLVQQILETFRQIIITDTGTDLTNPVIEAVMECTDTLVVPASTAQDGADLAWETLDTWERRSARGQELVRNAVVPITQHYDGPQVPLEALRQAFAGRVRSVVMIPHDKHLAGGGVFEWDHLHRKTQRAQVELAAAIAQDFTKSGYSWASWGR